MRALSTALIVGALVACVAETRAATFVVNSTAATDDAVCAVAAGGCTLADAIQAAVATPGRDTIAFDPVVFPLGAPGVISTEFPAITDAAGTVIDGVGAGVVLDVSGGGNGIGGLNGLLFASGTGAPLGGVTVANLTVRGYTASGILVCGGAPPVCDQDIAGVLVQNVVVEDNTLAGVQITGAAVTKVRIVNSVASRNGSSGFECAASQSLTGTQIAGSIARDNGSAGFDFQATFDTIGTSITDTVAVHNGAFGIGLGAERHLAKVKLTRVAAVMNQSFGILLEALEDIASTTIATSTANNNMIFGVRVAGSTRTAGVTIKDVIANGNLGGIVLSSDNLVTGAKLTNAVALGNQNSGITLGADIAVIGNTITGGAVTRNGGHGIHIEGSNNVVQRVRAAGNTGDGIHLGAQFGVGNKIQKCSSTTNDGHGIFVAIGSTGTIVQKNVALGNDANDLFDENPGCGGNIWKQNVFTALNDACIR